MNVSVISETTKHDVGISQISNAVADYVCDVVIPHLKEEANQGRPVSSLADPEIEYYILSGYPIKNGYVGGTQIEDNQIDDFYIYVNKMNRMVTGFRGIDKDIVKILYKIPFYLILSNQDRNGDAFYTPEDKSISIVLDRMFTGKNKINKSHVSSLIAHELRHALDDLLSGGKAFSGDEDKLNKASAIGDDKRFDQYLKLASEANARFAQAAKDLIDYVNSKGDKVNIADFKDFMKDVVSTYELLSTTKKKQYKRFMGRAYKLFNELKNENL